MSNLSKAAAFSTAIVLLGFSMLPALGCQQRATTETPAEAPGPAPVPLEAHASALDFGEIPELDLTSLSPLQQALFRSVVEDQFDPCGRAMSFGEALRSQALRESCPLVVDLARFVVERVRAGEERATVIRALLDETRRRHREVTLRLEGRPRRGPEAPRALIVQFTNYACRFCREVQPQVDALLDAHPDVALVVKHCPLRGAEWASSLAALVFAAAEEGQGYALHRRFAAPEDAPAPPADAALERILIEAGLDPAVIRERVQDDRFRRKLAEELEDAERVMLEGIPSFWLDGQEMPFEALGPALAAGAGDTDH